MESEKGETAKQASEVLYVFRIEFGAGAQSLQQAFSAESNVI
jgi:hypothetical protein